jgi:hypothetical protein
MMVLPRPAIIEMLFQRNYIERKGCGVGSPVTLPTRRARLCPMLALL